MGLYFLFIIVSILALDIFRSVRFAHRHVLAKLSDTSLNAYYYALKTDRLDHESWRNVTLSKALKAVPVHLAAQPLFLSPKPGMTAGYLPYSARPDNWSRYGQHGQRALNVIQIYPGYGVNGWFMPLSRSQKAGMEAAGSSSACLDFLPYAKTGFLRACRLVA